MKSIVSIAVAVVALLGIGYYFAQSHYGFGAPSGVSSGVPSGVSGASANGVGASASGAIDGATTPASNGAISTGASNDKGSARANGEGQGALANGGLNPVEDASLHPEKDGAQFVGSHGGAVVNEAVSNPQPHSITFEGAELPSGDQVGRHAHDSDTAKKNAKEWQDPKFANPTDESEIVGAYVPQKPTPQHKSIKGRPGHIDDDLLIMEGRSEDRLASSTSAPAATH